jgi:hypothetical protein
MVAPQPAASPDAARGLLTNVYNNDSPASQCSALDLFLSAQFDAFQVSNFRNSLIIRVWIALNNTAEP